MKIICSLTLLSVYKITNYDCGNLILSFAFYDVDTYKKQCMKKIRDILYDGYSRTRVNTSFYQMWNDAEQDSYWLHIYVDHKITILENENCVRCGNYRIPYLNHFNKAILCTCGFVEMYEDLN